MISIKGRIKANIDPMIREIMVALTSYISFSDELGKELILKVDFWRTCKFSKLGDMFGKNGFVFNLTRIKDSNVSRMIHDISFALN